ncbi:MAG: hypothetical protein DI605_07000 [Sphingomonas sp.]|nr:MAG: hypothetical protein DI605_07000 [Sphingomonas sp.]
MPSSLSRRVGSLLGRRPSPTARALEALSIRLAEMDRTLRRIQRDVEQVKLFSSTTLGNDRAIALLATGERILLDPRDRGCGLNLLSQGRYEETEINVLRRFARPGTVFLDIGANYGYYTVCAAPYLRPGGRAIAFEPNPHIHSLLAETLYTNNLGDVAEARCLGVYDRNDTLRFEIDETGPGGAHILSSDQVGAAHTNVIEVPVVRLDDHLPADLIVNLVKIDVEGREEQVLRGMCGTIARSPDIVIIMEIYRGFFRNDEAFTGFLRFVEEDLGLTISLIDPAARLMPASRQLLASGMRNVVLSKGAPPRLPALTILPAALDAGRDSVRGDEQIHWRQESGASRATTPIANGPYVFLPAGTYHLVIEGLFSGRFTCQLLENVGDLIWQARFDGGTRHSFRLFLPFDMPRFEIAFWPADTEQAEFSLISVTLWNEE